MELKRWVDERTGAFDWGHAAKLHAEMEESSDQLLDKEGKVRSVLHHVMKCDLEKEDMMDPIILTPADCVISAWLLGLISRDQNNYVRYLRKFSKLLKPGGHIILVGSLNATYFTVGKYKLYYFTYDEDLVRNAIAEAGFVIDNCNVKKRTAVSDLTDYKAVIFIAAHKKK
ncbi:indolethylamine N-methyltransferase-like [Phyllobates terribilis]|uniref:indolethylamine N-methyltransferase-like n=1 Tax=Phyllobates terribilis TaxID=111132 RepID=UPI003CCAE58C